MTKINGNNDVAKLVLAVAHECTYCTGVLCARHQELFVAARFCTTPYAQYIIICALERDVNTMYVEEMEKEVEWCYCRACKGKTAVGGCGLGEGTDVWLWVEATESWVLQTVEQAADALVASCK